jgi:hypothetical protein
MVRRERSVRRGLKILGGPDRLLNFFKAIRPDDDCTAVRLIVEEINSGQSIEAGFFTGDEFGFSLEVESADPGRYVIRFGCQPSPMVGDGGEWVVSFGPDGTIESIECQSTWLS